jgi:hypothetical protein
MGKVPELREKSATGEFSDAWYGGRHCAVSHDAFLLKSRRQRVEPLCKKAGTEVTFKERWR